MQKIIIALESGKPTQAFLLSDGQFDKVIKLLQTLEDWNNNEDKDIHEDDNVLKPSKPRCKHPASEKKVTLSDL